MTSSDTYLFVPLKNKKEQETLVKLQITEQQTSDAHSLTNYELLSA